MDLRCCPRPPSNERAWRFVVIGLPADPVVDFPLPVFLDGLDFARERSRHPFDGMLRQDVDRRLIHGKIGCQLRQRRLAADRL